MQAITSIKQLNIQQLNIFWWPAADASWHRLLRRTTFIVRFIGRLFRPG